MYDFRCTMDDLGNSRACARTWRSLPYCWPTSFIHRKRKRNGLNKLGEDFFGTRKKNVFFFNEGLTIEHTCAKRRHLQGLIWPLK